MQVKNNIRLGNTKQYNNYRDSKKDKSQQNFKGGVADVAFNVLDKGFAILDKNPMIQVSFVDTVATNIPRTLVDLKTGLAAALETCRREFSGLFVNCLMGGLIVKCVAGILPKANELKDTGVVGSWANGDTINKLKGAYQQAQTSGATDTTREFVSNAIGSLQGLEGKTWVKYADKAAEPQYQEAITQITDAISKTGKDRAKLLKSAQTKLAGLTKAESILNFVDKANNKALPNANLEETLRDIADMGSKFNKVKDRTLTSMGKTVADMADPEVSKKVTGEISKYGKSLTSFVNKKSLIGMGIVIGIAVSIQSINRAITRKQFNAEGAPIYKDFGKKQTAQKMDEEQKKKFRFNKAISAIGMYGLAALSMMKKPSLGMFQFSGIFPTLDQCRWIAASTNASRMLAAEDQNELRETIVRDTASFAGLYFLGDYVKKGVASGIEALSKTKAGAKLVGENVVLLNRIKDVPKPNLSANASFIEKAKAQTGYRLKQFGNWIKNTDLKSAAEVSSTKTRNLRNICRVADIAFSIVALGIVLPKYNRAVTEKKVAEAKKLEEMQKQVVLGYNNEANTPQIFKGLKIN